MLHQTVRHLLHQLDDPRMAGAPAPLLIAAKAHQAIAVAVTRQTQTGGVGPIIATAAATLLDSGEIPADFEDQLGSRHGEDAAAEAVRAGYGRLLAEVEDRLGVLAREHARDLLVDVLRPELHAVMTDLGKLTEQAGGRAFTDPEAFIGASPAVQAAWAAVGPLAERYEWLRVVQRTILTAIDQDTSAFGPAFTSHAYESPDFAGVWPTWAAALVGREPSRPDPWPTETRARFLFAAQYRPWMPSPQEMVKAMTDANERQHTVRIVDFPEPEPEPAPEVVIDGDPDRQTSVAVSRRRAGMGV